MALIDGLLGVGVAVSDTLFDLVTNTAQTLKAGVQRTALATNQALPVIPLIHEPPPSLVPGAFMPSFSPGSRALMGGPRARVQDSPFGEGGRILINL